MTASPLANADQFAAEKDVTAMWDHPDIARARAAVGELFELAYARDTLAADRPGFAGAMDEYITNYLFKAAASDGGNPRFVRDFMPAYAWDGRAVPGARMGGDNPDNCYRLAAIAPGGRYRVVARPCGAEPANTSFTLTANFGTSVTIQTIESHEIERDADGGFTLTIDDRPAEGRRNHLTSAPHVKFIYVRESFSDWAAECSYHLTIERLDPVSTPRVSLDEMAARAAFRAMEDVPLYAWFQRLFSGLPLNSLRPPKMSDSLGGLVTQAGVQGWYRLEADEALVIRYQPAGAAYAAIAAGDWWFRSLDAHVRQSSLTDRQSVVGPDGWISAVMARTDPGIANWIDIGDAPTALLFLRWQGLPASQSGEAPRIDADVMRLSALSDAVTAHQLIDAEARLRQLEQRRVAWVRRTTVGAA